MKFINVDIICVANTVIKKIGLNRYIARKTLNVSLINYFCKLYDLPLPNSPNRRKRVTLFLAECTTDGLIVMLF